MHTIVSHACSVIVQYLSKNKPSLCKYIWYLHLLLRCQMIYKYINLSILPGQTGSPSHEWLVRLGMDLSIFCDVWTSKQAKFMPFGHIIIWIGTLYYLMATHSSYSPACRSTCWPWTPCEKLSKMVDNLTDYSLKSLSTEKPWMTVDSWRIAYKQLYVFLKLNISKTYFLVFIIVSSIYIFENSVTYALYKKMNCSSYSTLVYSKWLVSYLHN